MSLPIYIFIHVAAVNHWADILADQLAKIESSGLMAKAQDVLVNFVGIADDATSCKILDWPWPSKVRALFGNTPLSAYEFPTLQTLQVRAETTDCHLVYCHSKGSCNLQQNSEQWRMAMERYILTNHEHAIGMLERGYDVAAGIAAIEHEEKGIWYPTGNFWLATSDHIKRLPKVSSLDQTCRFQAEQWVCGPRRTRAYYHTFNVRW